MYVNTLKTEQAMKPKLTNAEKQKIVKKYEIKATIMLIIFWVLSLWGIVAISRALPESIQGLFMLTTWISLIFYSAHLFGKTTNRYREILELEELKNTYEKYSRMYVNRLRDFGDGAEEAYKEYLNCADKNEKK